MQPASLQDNHTPVSPAWKGILRGSSYRSCQAWEYLLVTKPGEQARLTRLTWQARLLPIVALLHALATARGMLWKDWSIDPKAEPKVEPWGPVDRSLGHLLRMFRKTQKSCSLPDWRWLCLMISPLTMGDLIWLIAVDAWATDSYGLILSGYLLTQSADTGQTRVC